MLNIKIADFNTPVEERNIYGRNIYMSYKYSIFKFNYGFNFYNVHITRTIIYRRLNCTEDIFICPTESCSGFGYVNGTHDVRKI